MKALQKNDICYSTVATWNKMFNTDGKERNTLSVEEARSAIDFKIIKEQSYDRSGRPIPKHFHLERDTDHEIIPSVGLGDKFVPVQHIDVFDYIVKEVMPKVPDMSLEMCGTIHGLGTGVIAARLGEVFKIKGDKSPSEMRLLFSNPNSGTGRLTLGFTTVRIVCQNTLMAATRQANADGWRIKHTPGAVINCENALKELASCAQAAIEMKQRSERLAGIGVDSATVKKVLDSLYPLGVDEQSPAYLHMKTMRDEVLRQFEEGETALTFDNDKTAWRLLNAATYPIFNGRKISVKTDRTEIAYKGMVQSRVSEKTTKIFNTVERIALGA